jgi:hypothetical protein
MGRGITSSDSTVKLSVEKSSSQLNRVGCYTYLRVHKRLSHK